MVAFVQMVYRILEQDPVLQSKLFAIQKSDLFLAELIQLCEDNGAAVSEYELIEALRQGRRRWLERDLP